MHKISVARVLFLVGCDQLGYKLDPVFSLGSTLLDPLSFLKYQWIYLFIMLLRISLISISVVKGNFSYCPRNWNRRTQFRTFSFLTLVKKAVTISRHSEFPKKNFISSTTFLSYSVKVCIFVLQSKQTEFSAILKQQQNDNTSRLVFHQKRGLERGQLQNNCPLFVWQNQGNFIQSVFIQLNYSEDFNAANVFLFSFFTFLTPVQIIFVALHKQMLFAIDTLLHSTATPIITFKS